MPLPTYSLPEILGLLEGCTAIEASAVAGLVAEEYRLYHIAELNVIELYVTEKRKYFEAVLRNKLDS